MYATEPDTDLRAGTMEIQVYYLACGHVTWDPVPSADPPVTMHCRSCGTDMVMMGYESSVVIYDAIAERQAADRDVAGDLDGIDPQETAEHILAVALLNPQQLSGMLGWAQGRYPLVYNFLHTLLYSTADVGRRLTREPSGCDKHAVTFMGSDDACEACDAETHPWLASEAVASVTPRTDGSDPFPDKSAPDWDESEHVDPRTWTKQTITHHLFAHDRGFYYTSADTKRSLVEAHRKMHER